MQNERKNARSPRRKLQKRCHCDQESHFLLSSPAGTSRWQLGPPRPWWTSRGRPRTMVNFLPLLPSLDVVHANISFQFVALHQCTRYTQTQCTVLSRVRRHWDHHPLLADRVLAISCRRQEQTQPHVSSCDCEGNSIRDLPTILPMWHTQPSPSSILLFVIKRLGRTRIASTPPTRRG